MLVRVFFCAFLIVTGVCFNVRAQHFIDSFDAGVFSFTISGENGFTTIDADPGEILGGRRVVGLNQEYNRAVAHSELEIQPGTGFFDYTRQQNGGMNLQYGWYASVPINADLTASGNDRFALDVLAAPGPFRFALAVRDNSSQIHEAAVGHAVSGAGMYEIPFSAFGPMEFDKIAGVYFTMAPGFPPENGPGLYRFGYLAAVPEPSTCASVAACALIGLAGFRLKKSSSFKVEDISSKPGVTRLR